MTHGRKPRKPRPARLDNLQLVQKRATLLTAEEVADTMAAARLCATRLREGVATEDQHTVLHTCLQIALGIEASGIVRGLHGHLDKAAQAMAGIRARATATSTWRPTALHYYELDAITEAVDLHEYQLRQVSAGELHAISKKLIARTLSTGGVAMRTNMNDLGLQAA